MSKIQILEWDDSININILCVYSSLPDNQLAFQLNKALDSTLINSVTDFINITRKGEFTYTIFQSEKSETNCPIFLLKNKSINSTAQNNDSSLFESSTVQSPLIQTLNKWPYLLFSEDPAFSSLAQIITKIKNISYCQVANYSILKKNEQSILTSILYNEQH